MCIANLADYDDDTARAIWRHELQLQARDRQQRDLSEIQGIARYVRGTLDALPADPQLKEPPSDQLPAGSFLSMSAAAPDLPPAAHPLERAAAGAFPGGAGA